MKNSILITLLFTTVFLCYSQSAETSLYLKEELVKQRDELLQKAQELQARIDAIDKKLNQESTKKNTHYITKNVSHHTTNTYSNSANKGASRNTSYRVRSSRTYHRGPRGGCYYINSNGNKTYVARSKCN